MKWILKQKSGMSHVTSAVLVLLIAMLFAAVFLYSNIMTIMQTTKDQTQRVLDDFMMHNSIEIYNSLKNGNDFSAELDGIFYKSQIFSAFSLDNSGNSLYAVDEAGNILYTIANIHVDYDIQNTMKLIATYDLIIPIRFAGNSLHMLDMKIPIKVRSYYVLKTS